MRPIPSGASTTHTVIPGPESLASAAGNAGVDVVSSPWLVGLLEETSHRLIRGFFEPNEVTVGVGLALRHKAPALPGLPIVGRARLLSLQGRRLTFAVDAYQEDRLLMEGSHERVLVQLQDFSGKKSAPAAGVDSLSNLAPIAFYFDFHSPWCWFASLRVEALAARVGRRVDWRPMSLARLIDRIGGRRPLDENAAFVGWFKQDMQDTAQAMGLKFSYHPKFPLRPARALRAAVLAAEKGCAAAFVTGVMAAYWSTHEDIESLDTLASIGERSGLAPDAVRHAAADERYKQAVEENTLLAQKIGIFGAPSFDCDGKIFWGNDRMDFMESYLLARRAIET